MAIPDMRRTCSAPTVRKPKEKRKRERKAASCMICISIMPLANLSHRRNCARYVVSAQLHLRLCVPQRQSSHNVAPCFGSVPWWTLRVALRTARPTHICSRRGHWMPGFHDSYAPARGEVETADVDQYEPTRLSVSRFQRFPSRAARSGSAIGPCRLPIGWAQNRRSGWRGAAAVCAESSSASSREENSESFWWSGQAGALCVR